ncbi:MAG: tetratricopeptide repeat protein, partial [Bacteroidales bacterium]|nr:tetratricopeptide repeat protein [Bacteroidales bacterium]
MKSLSRLWVFLIFLGILVSSCQQVVEKKMTDEQPKKDSVNIEIETLNDQIYKDSLNPENYYQRSLYYIDKKEINHALSDIGKAIALNDKDADYFVALSDIYLAMGKIPNCLEALKKAEELDPKNNDALLKLAEVYLILKDYQNTFGYTKKALDHDLINPVAYFIRGYAYMEQGDTALAIKSYQAAADQDQQYYAAFIELGVLYAALKNPVAAGYFKTAINIDPNRGEAYYLLGMVYQEQEIIPKAIETYEKLLIISPGYKEAHYNMGYINLVYINDFETAIRYFSQAISLDPKYTDAYFNRGYSYELAGDLVNARKDYLKSLEITPNYERSIIGLNRLDA